MTSIPHISRAYAARGAIRNLATRRRISPTTTTLLTLAPNDYYYSNRLIPRFNSGSSSHFYFSSVSTIDNDDDGDDDDGDTLKSAIERLKAFRSTQPRQQQEEEEEEEESGGNTIVIYGTGENIIPGLETNHNDDHDDHDDDNASTKDLELNVMKPSPFAEEPTPTPSSLSIETPFKTTSPSRLDAKKEFVRNVVVPKVVSKEPPPIVTNREESNKKPNLSDLMQTDIFAKSWSEPDTASRGAGGRGDFDTTTRRTADGYTNNNNNNNGNSRGKNNSSNTWPYNNSSGAFSDTTTATRRTTDDNNNNRGNNNASKTWPYNTTTNDSTFVSNKTNASAYDSSARRTANDINDRGNNNKSQTWPYNTTTTTDDSSTLRSSNKTNNSKTWPYNSTPATDDSTVASNKTTTWPYTSSDSKTSDSTAPPRTKSSSTSSSNTWPYNSSSDSMTARGDDDYSSSEMKYQEQQPPSAAAIEYNKLVEETNTLLDSLFKQDDETVSTTLQLMDFDKVMTKWSRFHAQVDANGSDTGAGNDNQGLNQKASEQCMLLLQALEHNYDASGEPQTKHHSQLMPNAASYNLALHTLAHSNKGQFVAQEAHDVLTRMLDRCQDYLDRVENDSNDDDLPSLPPCEPNIITFNSAIHAIAKSGARDAGHCAEGLFAKMDAWNEKCAKRSKSDCYNPTSNERTHYYHGVQPNARTLACTIDAWANAKQTTQRQSFAPERVEALLDLAIQRRRAYVEGVTGKVVGGLSRRDDSYTDIEDEPFELLDEQEASDVFTDDDDVVEETVDEEELLLTEDPEEEEGVPPTMPYSLRPNTVAFNTCIHTWAASGRGREGAMRAQELLARLEALSESGELDLPDEIMDADDSSSEEMDNTLKPNVRTYSMVMNAWANVAKVEQGSGEYAASHCEDILDKMEVRGAMDSSVRPNLVAYVTAISAWARTKDVEHAASRAEDILNRMIDLYYDTEDGTMSAQGKQPLLLEGDVENAKHDAPFNAVITAYARSSDPHAAERALAVLERLEATTIISPTATSYNAVMDVCAKHGQPERALEVLGKMQEMPGIATDSTSYDTVLNAFAQCEKEGMAERAYEYLCQLEEERSSGDNESSNNNYTSSSLSYSTVINAFARASGKEYGGLPAVKKSKEIYERLIDQIKDGVIYGDADSFSASGFLNCCANVYGTRSEKKQVLVMAINMFEEMKKRPDLHGEPNQFIFGTMMKACARLSSDNAEKERLMEHLFVQACKRGTCSKSVLGQFLRNTPSHLNTKVILSLGGTKRKIPDSWYRTVAQRQWPTLMN